MTVPLTMVDPKKQLVVGLGEIGKPIFKLIGKKNLAVGCDVSPKIFDEKQFQKNTKQNEK